MTVAVALMFLHFPCEGFLGSATSASVSHLCVYILYIYMPLY